MGTNYYLSRRREVDEHWHVAKATAGWRTSWQTSDDAYDPPDEPEDGPVYHSVAEIRALLKSGGWRLVDEYGQEHDPSELDNLEERVGKSHDPWADFRDHEGNEFTFADFR